MLFGEAIEKWRVRGVMRHAREIGLTQIVGAGVEQCFEIHDEHYDIARLV